MAQVKVKQKETADKTVTDCLKYLRRQDLPDVHLELNDIYICKMFGIRTVSPSWRIKAIDHFFSRIVGHESTAKTRLIVRGAL